MICCLHFTKLPNTKIIDHLFKKCRPARINDTGRHFKNDPKIRVAQPAKIVYTGYIDTSRYNGIKKHAVAQSATRQYTNSA